MNNDLDKSMGNQKTMGGAKQDDRSMGNMPTVDGMGHLSGKRFQVGDVILGRYRVIDELGQGGMGVVYRCFDKTACIDVAIKALPPKVAHDKGEMEEVRENFRLVSKLHHPNIANVNTLEQDPETNDYYLVMECVQGLDLRQWARRRRGEGRSLTLDEVTILAYRIASALDFAHEQKVIHRDIKPGNVRVTFDGEVKVLDFGLAAQLYTSMSHVSDLHYDTRGTAAYMAPEQWQGLRQGAATDQYALAATVYELLSGSPPFKGHNLSVLREAVLKAPAHPIVDLPQHVNDALLRALSKEETRRFVSCDAFVKALAGLGQKLEIGGRKVPRLALKNDPFMDRATTSSKGGIPESSRFCRTKGGSQGRHQAMEFLRLAAALSIAGLACFGFYVGWLSYQSHKAAIFTKQQLEKSLRIKADILAEKEKNDTNNELIKKDISALQSQAFIKANAAETEVQTLGRGQGFGAKMDEMSQQHTAADQAMKAQDFALAKAHFNKCVFAAEWITRNAPLKKQYLAMQIKASMAQKEAEAMEGPKLAMPDFNSAVLMKTDADSIFERGGFLAARGMLEQACDFFAKSIKEAQGIKVGQALESAKEAKTAGHFETSMLLKTTVDGEEVKANFILGAQPYMTPIRLKLKMNSTYRGLFRYSNGVRKYRVQKAFIADWKGERAVTVALVEVQAAKTGEPYMLDLMGSDILELMYIQPATFMMGSPEGEIGRRDNEKQYRVTLLQGYWIARHEVTQAQWMAVMRNNPSEFTNGGDYPVERVSWKDAMAFCREVTERERAAGLLPPGYAYSLPTEAQWEYACRAGTTTALNNGKNLSEDKSNCPNLDAVGWYDMQKEGFSTHPVGQKKANAWGLYDMHGNVWEWCRDWYAPYPVGSGTDPECQVTGSGRVYRGGSWINDAKYCRSAYRAGYSPDHQSSNIGFRMVLSAVP